MKNTLKLATMTALALVNSAHAGRIQYSMEDAVNASKEGGNSFVWTFSDKTQRITNSLDGDIPLTVNVETPPEAETEPEAEPEKVYNEYGYDEDGYDEEGNWACQPTDEEIKDAVEAEMQSKVIDVLRGRREAYGQTHDFMDDTKEAYYASLSFDDFCTELKKDSSVRNTLKQKGYDLDAMVQKIRDDAASYTNQAIENDTGRFIDGAVRNISLVGDVGYKGGDRGDCGLKAPPEWLETGVISQGPSGGIYVDTSNPEAFQQFVSDFTCFTADTLISLADGTSKKAEDITYDDELLVWNFDEGKFDKAKPLWLQIPRIADEYNYLRFSDGSVLKTIKQHRILNIEAGKFTYPMTDDTPIGTHTLNAKGEVVELLEKKVVQEKVTYYNLMTYRHINCFTSNICTSSRLNNIYPIKDLKFVKDDRELVPYAQFARIEKEWYDGFRLAEQPFEINRDHSDDHGDKTVEDYVLRIMSITQV